MSVFYNSNGDLYSTGWHSSESWIDDEWYYQVSKIEMFDNFKAEIKDISVGSKTIMVLWSNG